MLVALIKFLIGFVIPIIGIPAIVYYLKKKKGERIEIIIGYIGLFILSIIFINQAINLPQFIKGRANYESSLKINDEDIIAVIFVKNIRIEGKLYPVKYIIINENEISDVNLILKMNSFALVQGNLKDIEYWDLNLITNKKRIIYYKIMDTPKDLYIMQYSNGIKMSEYKNNYLRPILNSLKGKEPIYPH